MRVIVFDLDGTLADTSGDLLAAANACFHQMGHGDVLSRARDAGTALRGGRAMLKAGFERLEMPVDEAEITRWYPVLLEAYEAAIDHHTVLFDGARDAVSRIAARGDRAAICTNKPFYLADKLMKKLDFHTEFASLIGADTLPVRKPDPAPFLAAVERSGGAVARSVLIGDTVTDRKTAEAAGVPSILVSFAPGTEDVAALEPEAIIDHFDELDAVLDRLL